MQGDWDFWCWGPCHDGGDRAVDCRLLDTRPKPGIDVWAINMDLGVISVNVA